MDADLPLDRLRALFAEVLPANPFYRAKLAGRSPDDWPNVPFTTKAELTADQLAAPPYGTNLTYPLSRYTRLHQSSGTTTGRPLRWLDTPESWAANADSWRRYFIGAMGLTPGRDRLFFPFSFGPFLGFWTAWDAATGAGYFALSGGNMPTAVRLRVILDHGITAVFATPTYALHLAEVAAREGIDLASSAVRAVIVAGEPGGGLPATRARIEAGWGARVFDQYGLTEVGPAAVEPADAPGCLAVDAQNYVAEVVDPTTAGPTPVGEVGELVLTNLHRPGSPLIRYRTGDLVRRSARISDWGPLFDGGVLGRTDDMLHVRGNNLYPAALEGVIRRFPEVAEYRLVVRQSGPLADVRVELEPLAEAGSLADRVAKAIREELHFRADVLCVAPGTLPRFEMKARRVVRE